MHLYNCPYMMAEVPSLDNIYTIKELKERDIVMIV